MLRILFIAGIAGSLMAASALSGAAAPDWASISSLYRAAKLKLAEQERDLAMEQAGGPLDFKAAGTNFFSYQSEGIKGLQAMEGGLRFMVAGTNALLAWGNYQNRQPAGRRGLLWPDWNLVELRVRQSAPASEWTVALWQDGRCTHPLDQYAVVNASQSLKGTNWQTLAFFVQMPRADGFSIAIKGSDDNVVELNSVRVLKKERFGYFRREFTVPPGKIWSAAAEISRDMKLFVNGTEVDSKLVNSIYMLTTPVNLGAYLKPGRNCLAMVGREVVTSRNQSLDWYPNIGYLQGAVVMADGQRIVLDTPAGWLASETAPGGWTGIDFDAGSWKPAEPFPGYNNDKVEIFTRVFPAYDGRLELHNRGNDPKLFFSDTNAICVTVDVPEGLAAEKPTLQWVLRSAPEYPGTNSMEADVACGEVIRFERAGSRAKPPRPAIRYAINAGLHRRGVYTLEVGLYAGARLIEKRIREPLVVVGKISMPEVNGTNFEDGLKLEWEDTIDFTNPADLHPWLEAEKPDGSNPAKAVTEPRIIRQDGLVYRETTSGGVGSGLAAHYAYRFAFRKPDSFYLLALDYPDDADRCIGVSVESETLWGGAPASRYCAQNQSGPGVITGFKYPLTGKMKELRWLHYAYSSNQVVEIASLAKGRRAAASRLRIYRVAELAAAQINQTRERWFGIHTERADTVQRLFAGDYWAAPMNYYHTAFKVDMVGEATQRLWWFLRGAENYTRYLRFSGQNLHVMGAFQYDESNESYMPPARFPGARVPTLDCRETTLRVFEQNGIAMLSMVEYLIHKSLSRANDVSDAQVVAGTDTLWSVSREGKQGRGDDVCMGHANFNHPKIREAYLRVVDDLAQKFSFSPAWKGIYIYAYPTFSGPAVFAVRNTPYDYDYSDATMAAFERDTGIKLPVDARDPKRFEKRYVWLTSEVMKPRWTAWRCQSLRSLLLKTRDVLDSYRPDLQLMYGCDFSWVGERITAWVKSGRTYLDWMRESGWDPPLYARDANIWIGRYLYPNDTGALWGRYDSAAVWEHHVSREVIDAYAREDNRLAVMNTSWHEVDLLKPGTTQSSRDWSISVSNAVNWPLPWVHIRFVSQAGGDNAREKFVQAMIGSDPEIVMAGFTDAMFPFGAEQPLREFARVLLALPKEKFQPVGDTCDFRHNLAIRDLRRDRDYWFYVANPGYWPIQGQVVLSGAGKVIDPATGDVVPTQEQNGKTIVPVDLKGFGIAAFVVRGLRLSSGVRVAAWTNAPVARADLEHMRKIIADAERLLATRAVVQVLTLPDREFVAGVVRSAAVALDAGEYARAWGALTNWKFWTLVFEQLKAYEKYAAAITGYEPKACQPGQIPSLSVVRAVLPPAIDGRLDDAVWKQAPRTEGFMSSDFSGNFLGIPIVATTVQTACDGRNLYLAFAMADPDIKALKAGGLQPPDVLNGWDDAIVMFFNPDASQIYQMAVNPAGLKYNANATGRASGFRQQDADFGPWQAAVARSDNIWIVEVAIPFATLKAPAPKSGDQWRANFLRRFRLYMVPEMYWSMIRKTWYDTERYGLLTFL